MSHPLEVKYDLTAQELLDAIDRRFRLKVALEGAVAEVHFERKLKVAVKEGWLADYESHDVDGMHDFTFITLKGTKVRVEVKTVRKGSNLQVELQKTRAAKGDPSSRYYDLEHFDVVAVCMGRSTEDWSQFMYTIASRLPSHKDYVGKLRVMHPIENPEGEPIRWFSKLRDLIDEYERIIVIQD